MLDTQLQLKPASERRSTPFQPTEPLPFGKLRSEHMFLMDYAEGEWQNPRIVPYGPLPLLPGAKILNYGQGIFEGQKAFLHDDHDIYLFRPDQHAHRLNRSAELMCIPPIPEEDQLQALETLIDVDRLCVPEQNDACLYIRPLVFGNEDALGVNPSKTYTYAVFFSPSGPYYDHSKPLKLFLTQEFHRVAPGGVGRAKAAGNYGGSLYALQRAHELGAFQVLYLDVNNQRIEETGASNHCHVTKDDEVIIPPFTDTILESVTTHSLLSLEERLGIPFRQEDIPIEQFISDVKSGAIREAGVMGTAMVIGAVGSYVFDNGKSITVGKGKVGPIVERMYQLLTNIQTGKEEAPAGWLWKVPRRI